MGWEKVKKGGLGEQGWGNRAGEVVFDVQCVPVRNLIFIDSYRALLSEPYILTKTVK